VAEADYIAKHVCNPYSFGRTTVIALTIARYPTNFYTTTYLRGQSISPLMMPPKVYHRNTENSFSSTVITGIRI
jgi:hypothetical protein